MCHQPQNLHLYGTSLYLLVFAVLLATLKVIFFLPLHALSSAQDDDAFGVGAFFGLFSLEFFEQLDVD